MESSSFTTTTTSHSRSLNILNYRKFGSHYLANNNLFIIILLVVIPVTVALAVGAEALKLVPGEIVVGSLRINLQEESQQLQVLGCLFLVIILATVYFMSKPPTIYLVDFACFKPPVYCRVSTAAVIEHLSFNLSPESLLFTKRIIERSGLGNETSLPPLLHYIDPSPTLNDARWEAELVIFSSIDTLLSKPTTSITPTDIDVLILNSSLFNPIPSLTSAVVNKYKMRTDVKTFNLGSMGCSGSSIAVDLAADILRRGGRSRCSYALVVSTEILTSSFYKGDVREMLLPNCLFRMGCAAVLLSNKDGGGGCGGRGPAKAKYKLSHVVRTNTGAVDDGAYRCVYGKTDSRGNVGVSLSKDLMKVAGVALEMNIFALAPRVLPVSEMLRYVVAVMGRKVRRRWRWWYSCGVAEEGRKKEEEEERYVPDFKTAFEHICVHAGGKAVVDGVQRSLKLTDEEVEASRMTLHRFGNTSASCLWYVMAYIEAKGRMRKRDRVWQIFFGSGYKCNSVVWECVRDVGSDECGNGPWADCIHRYPVKETPPQSRVI